MKYVLLVVLAMVSNSMLMKPKKLLTISCSYKNNLVVLKNIDTKQVLIEQSNSRIFIKDIEHLNSVDDYIQFKKDDKNVIYSLECKNVI